LKDSKGRAFDMLTGDAASQAGENYQKKTVYSTEQPGFKDDYVLVYDTAPDATGYVLAVRP
jgi:hypothetical protein